MPIAAAFPRHATPLAAAADFHFSPPLIRRQLYFAIIDTLSPCCCCYATLRHADACLLLFQSLSFYAARHMP